MLTSWFAVDVLGRLWQISWQSAVIAGLVLILRLLFGRALTSRWRHGLWLLVLCRLLMPVLPESPVSLFKLQSVVANLLATRAAAVEPVATPVDTSTVVRTTVDSSPFVTDRDERIDVPPPASRSFYRQPMFWLASWLLVAFALIARLIAVNLRFNRLLANNARPADPRLTELLNGCFNEMQLIPTVTRASGPCDTLSNLENCDSSNSNIARTGRRPVSRLGFPCLAVTNLVDAPAVCGVFHPRILLPTSLASTLPDDQLRLIFLHELAHIKCRDIAVDWVWAILQALHWFNPILWLIAPLRRADRESARDEMVLSLTGPAQADRYGRTLLQLAQPLRLPLFCPGLVGMFSRRPHLRRRIEMIANFKGRRTGSTWIGITLLTIAGGCALTGPSKAPPATTDPGSDVSLSTTTQVTQDADDIEPPPTPAEAALVAKLDQKLPELRFNANSLTDVFDFLRDMTKANIYVDWPALERAGIAKDAPVTARLRDIKFSKALELIFKSVEGEDEDRHLGYVVDEGVLTISTRKELNKNVVTRRYDINDLLLAPVGHTDTPSQEAKNDAARPTRIEVPQGEFQQSFATQPHSERARRIDDLKQFITDNVDTNSWKDNGGNVGTISSSPLRAVLLITQTPESHRKIRALLNGLRVTADLQVSLRVQFFMVDESDPRQLPAVLRRAMERVKGNGSGQFKLTSAEQDEIHQAVDAKTATMLADPLPLALTVGREATKTSILTTLTIVQSYSTNAAQTGDRPVLTYEPVLGHVPIRDCRFDATAMPSPDHKHVSVEVRPTLCRVAVIAKQRWAGTSAQTLLIQRPIEFTAVTGMSSIVADGDTQLIDCGLFAQDADTGKNSTTQLVNDSAIAEQLEKAHHMRAYLMVTPVMLKSDDDPKPAVMWDSRK